MTVLEKGKFVKNFVRTKNGDKIVKIPHSNYRSYSKTDIEQIEPKVDTQYLENWAKYLKDIKDAEEWTKTYDDWAHFLYALNSIPEKDIVKYNLPIDYIII